MKGKFVGVIVVVLLLLMVMPVGAQAEATPEPEYMTYEQALSDWISAGKQDYIWAFEVSNTQSVRVYGWVNVRWATLKGTINLYRFEILRVGSGYCSNAVKL